MVTSKDVARVAGVSQATVSRVLSDSPLVTEKTRERVLAAIEQTGYAPDQRARAMRTSRSGNVGVVVAELSNPYFSEIIEALGRSLTASGYRMNVWVTDRSDDETDGAALRAIRERSVDGVIFTAVTPDSPELRAALDQGHPVVLMNRRAAGLECDAVVSDNVRGGALIARLLLQSGRRHPAFIGGNPAVSTANDRLAGYAQVFHDHGIDVDVDRVRLGKYSYHFGYDAMNDLIDSGREIDAVFCSNDILAFGALDALRSRGLRVPEDVWVVGYDDVRMAAWRSFDLTTVRLDVNALAEQSTQLLIRRLLDTARTPEVIHLSPEMVVRGSAPFPTIDG